MTEPRLIRPPIHERVLSSAKLKELPAPVPLVDGLLFLDSTAVLWGRWGIGKSFVTTGMALSVSTGMAWAGRRVRQGPVLYVIGEGVAGVGQRIRAWESYHGRIDQDVVWLPEPVNLLNTVNVAEVAAYCADLRPVLVVLDTLNRCLSGADENASAVMSTAVAAMDALRVESGGACVLAVHHPTKDGETARGHGALYGSLTTELKLSGAGELLSLETKKQKDAPELAPVPLSLTPWDVSAVVSGQVPSAAIKAHPLAGRIADTFGTDWVSKTDLLDVLGVSKTTFYEQTKMLVETGLLIKERRGRSTYYRVADPPPPDDVSAVSGHVRGHGDESVRPGGSLRPPGPDTLSGDSGLWDEFEALGPAGLPGECALCGKPTNFGVCADCEDTHEREDPEQ